jgi:hypothetical protein
MTLFWLFCWHDAFVGLRDDRFLRDGVFESIRLGLGFVCFHGTVGLRGIQSCRLIRWGGRRGRRGECVSVVFPLCTLLDVIGLLAMLQFVESIVNIIRLVVRLMMEPGGRVDRQHGQTRQHHSTRLVITALPYHPPFELPPVPSRGDVE